MNAEIIAVGSELLTPHRSDTNSLFLTEHLNRLGVYAALRTSRHASPRARPLNARRGDDDEPQGLQRPRRRPKAGRAYSVVVGE